MRKYQPLWTWLEQDGRTQLTLHFDELQKILGFPIDHSFLNAKKEALSHGYAVEKISLKQQTIRFRKNAAPNV